MPDAAPKSKPINMAVGLLSAVVGWAFAKYAGPSLWIPGFAALALLFLFSKTSFGPKYFTGATILIGAHVIWFLAGAILLNNFAPVALDILLLSAGLIWLLARPSLPPVLFLGLLELASLAYNVYQLSGVKSGSDAHRALSVHFLFRILAITALIVGYRFFLKSQAEPPPVAAVPEAPPVA